MAETEQTGAGLFASLRRLGATLLQSCQNRLELFAVELHEEKAWFIVALLWTAAVIVSGFMTLITITFMVVVLSPAAAKPYVMGGFAVFYAVSTLVCGLKLKKAVKTKPPPFADTLGEIKKDIDWLQSNDEP